MKEKNYKIDVHMIFISFLYSGIWDLALGILKTATSSLLICSWHYATPSQFVQEMYSTYSKSLLFTSISYVQESFKLHEVIHG